MLPLPEQLKLLGQLRGTVIRTYGLGFGRHSAVVGEGLVGSIIIFVIMLEIVVLSICSS